MHLPHLVFLMRRVIGVAKGERLNRVAHCWARVPSARFVEQWGRLLAASHLRKLGTPVGSLRHTSPSEFILLPCSLQCCDFDSCVLQGSTRGRGGASLLPSLFCVTVVSRTLLELESRYHGDYDKRLSLF